MNTECKKVEDVLIDYVEGTLPDILRAEIDAHIQSCTKCDRLIREFSPLWQSFSTQEKEAPSRSFWPDLVQRIQTDEKPEKIWSHIALGFKRSLRPVAIALLFLLGAFFGYQLGHVPENDGRAISGKEYFAEYLEAFQDFPLGSAGDFYLMYSVPEQGEAP